MKKEILVVLLLCLSIAKSQPILRQGWPIQVYPAGLSYHPASIVILNSESENPTLIIKGGTRVVSYDFNATFLDNYSDIQRMSLRGNLVPIRHSDISQFRIATITQPYTVTGCNLIIGGRNTGDLFRIADSNALYISNPYSYDMDNDGIDELLFATDSINCYRFDMSQYPNFPIGYGVRTQYSQTSLAIGRLPQYNQPILFYHLNNYFHVKQIDDSTEFPGFPISMQSNDVGSPPVVFPTQNGFVAYAFHAYQQSGRVKGLNQNGQVLFDYFTGGDASGLVSMSLIDIEGDGLPELFIPCASRVPLIYRWNGTPIQMPLDTINQPWVGGAFGNVVGYRPPNSQTYWFYSIRGSVNNNIFLIGRCGEQILQGFPIQFVSDVPTGSPSISLIPPYNDTLRIIFNYPSNRVVVYDLPCPSGGVMECETAHHDYGRSGFYQPRTIPYSWINRPFKGELPKNHRIKVFPNPTNAQFTIYFQTDAPKLLRLYNSNGQNVKEIYTNSMTSVSVPTFNFSAGTYYLMDENSYSIPVSIIK